MQLANAAQMRELDRRTIEEIGIPGIVLMENAGRATVDRMERSFGPLTGKTVCIFAGPGNNGGDGMVIARTVHGQGAFPFIFFISDPEQLQGDAAHNYAIVKKIRIPFQVLNYSEKMLSLIDTVLTLNRMHPIHSLVDAIFGTGLERNISGQFLDVINCINILRERHNLRVVSVDIPSGIHSDTGSVLGGAIHADLTVTYGLAKPGHYHHGGATVGRLEQVDIGIPSKIVVKAGLKGMVLDKSFIGTSLHQRLATAHKGSSGHLLILAGSEGKTGAALLCGRGALHSGAGLVTFAVPQKLNPIFETVLPEAMSVVLPTTGTCLSMEDCDQIVALAAEKQALILGPGMGTAETTAELILHLYTTIRTPQVIDADALTVLASQPEVIHQAAGPRIFTPHPGEMARLLGESVSTVQEDRLKSSQWLCAQEKRDRPPMITVLKGAGTVIADAEGAWAINSTGNPGMATGGMGDVLAGIIGGLLTQGYSPWDAACLGVCLHGLAADCIARSRPCGYTASEVARILPRVMKTCTLQPPQETLC